MQNSENSEKSKGILVFAHNTHVDYVRIADQTSRLASRFLGLPVSLITDADATPGFTYDRVIRTSNTGENTRTIDGESKPWRNHDRYMAYELTPYAETLLLDTDYLILDQNLLKLFETTGDYRLMHHSITPSGIMPESMGETSLPFVWATVMMFRKSHRSQILFSLWGRIQRNYEYYRALFNIRERNYRNDYALAMANIIINGYDVNESQGIPWNMMTIEQPVERMLIGNNSLRIYHDNHAIVTPYQNIHVMDKTYLQSTDFEKIVETICESA
jgi:hypothetical protein